MCPPAVPGSKDGLSVKLPVSTAAASSNSTVNNTLLQDSVAYYIDVTLTSSIALRGVSESSRPKLSNEY